MSVSPGKPGYTETLNRHIPCQKVEWEEEKKIEWRYIDSQPVIWEKNKDIGITMVYTAIIHGNKCYRETKRLNRKAKAINCYFIKDNDNLFSDESLMIKEILKTKRKV